MILILILILIIITIFIYFFVLNSVSPIPYFPTQWADLEFVSNEILNPKFQKISKSPNNQLPITSNHIIIDLGAGTGTVIFHAAKLAIVNNTRTKPTTKIAGGSPRGAPIKPQQFSEDLFGAVARQNLLKSEV